MFYRLSKNASMIVSEMTMVIKMVNRWQHFQQKKRNLLALCRMDQV